MKDADHKTFGEHMRWYLTRKTTTWLDADERAMLRKLYLGEETGCSVSSANLMTLSTLLRLSSLRAPLRPSSAPAHPSVGEAVPVLDV